MPAYLKKTRQEITSQAIQKVLNTTDLTSTGPGSIVRAIIEAVASELGDMYSILDYNINQTIITTATGAALDKMGTLYNTPRKAVNELATIDKQLGAFMFFVNSSYGSNILIPKGTNIYANTTSYIGQRFSYSTTEDAVLRAGSTRIFVSIAPNFSDAVYTAGKHTLIIHDAPMPGGVQLLCTNPKEIAPFVNMETDEQYRTRLIKAIRVAAAGTSEALRFAGLQVEGIRDVKIRSAPYGMGSFEAVIVPERRNNTNEVVERAILAMENVRPIGTRMYSITPDALPLTMDVGIIAPMAVNADAKENVVRRASVGISRYINSLLPGSELVYNQLIQIILDSSDIVRDVNVKSMSINNREIMRRNYRPADNEQVVLGDIKVQVVAINI